MSSPRQEGRENRRRGLENICISSTRRQRESEIEKAGDRGRRTTTVNSRREWVIARAAADGSRMRTENAVSVVGDLQEAVSVETGAEVRWQVLRSEGDEKEMVLEGSADGREAVSGWGRWRNWETPGRGANLCSFLRGSPRGEMRHKWGVRTKDRPPRQEQQQEME